jgi:hypothetical protein
VVVAEEAQQGAHVTGMSGARITPAIMLWNATWVAWHDTVCDIVRRVSDDEALSEGQAACVGLVICFNNSV